jgi:glycogen operon protein
MTTEEWEKDYARSLGMWLNGEVLPETDERGQRLQDASFLVLFNAHHDLIEFKLPQASGAWTVEIDTFTESGEAPPDHATAQDTYPLQGRSLVLLRQAASTPAPA